MEREKEEEEERKVKKEERIILFLSLIQKLPLPSFLVQSTLDVYAVLVKISVALPLKC